MASKNNADPSGMWTPYKELLAMVEMVIGHNKVEYLSDLEKHLTSYRTAIIALLDNPEKNAKQREELRKAPKEGIQIDGGYGQTKLSESFVTEALTLSDALNLSEFACVDLLVSAEQQTANFPGLSRGLVAALLYHDGRRCLVTALKLLITAKEGISWALDLDEQITTVINQYTEKLFNDGLIAKILQKLREIDLQGELGKLEKCKSIGDAKHKKQLTELITEQRNALADCLFCWACQSPFAKRETIAIMDFLKDSMPSTSDGSFDHTTLKVVMSLLRSWCTSGYEALVDELIPMEDANFPVFRDLDFVSSVHQAVIRPDAQHWKTPSIKAILQFAWAVFLRFLSQFQTLDSYSDIFEEDEELLSVAIDSDAFRFVRSCIVAADTFSHEEYCVRTVHALITTLIVNFPLKIKDLRNRGDENAKIHQARLSAGLDSVKAPRQDFQELMLLIGDLYKNDPQNLELSSDYWCPSEPFGSVFSPKPIAAYRQSLIQKQILLNKFIRVAGDLIPQPLFNSYVQMLTGLSSNERAAQFSFNLLSSDGSIGRSATCSATWDHFFQSFKQYYASLKQDIHLTDHLSHVHHHQNISPDELSALECVLDLITMLAEHSERVRIAFCDNKMWLPIATFFGLIGCPVPSSLKARLLNALAAFAKSPEISTIIWQSLEATQILATWTQHPSGKQETGIKVELEEIEARNECYPQTRAFVKLINRLVDMTIPSTLGAGYRVPGFAPYLEFLRDNVFLRFKSRAYQDSSEMWMVASAVLEIFVKILSNYEPLPEHMQDRDVEIQGVRFGKAAKPPGYELMLFMLNDTPMFRLVMNIIDILGKELDSSLPGKNSNEEKSMALCLKLIENCLEKQTVLLSMLRSENSSILITSMDKLLLSINPRTAEADYPYKIARCITLNNVDPDLTLSVVRILYLLSQTPNVQSEIIVNLASKKIEREQLLVGFCEFLEHEVPEELGKDRTVETEQDDGSQMSESAIRNAIRQNIVGLLLATLQQPSPNLAQFLLGFELQKSISKTVFQDAGVCRFPKTCLHSIISLLNRDIDSPSGPSCISETPKLAELMYQLIYFLCAHSETGTPCQRYLRTSHDFFVSHASKLPFVRPSLLEDGDEELFVLLSNQQSWLLKTIAIEIKMASQTRLRSSMVRILDVLYGQQTAQSNEFTQSLRGRAGDISLNVVSAILTDLELTQKYPSPFESNMFDVSSVEQLIASCDERSHDTGVIVCDVKRLHRMIMSELSNAQGMSLVGQRPEILKEVENILRYAVERNMIRRSLGAKRHAFEAWRQVVETSFAICHYDVFTGDRREAVILSLLQDMLLKVSDETAIPELISPVAGAIFMLMAQYHNIVVQRAIPSSRADQVIVDMTPLLRVFQGIVKCLCSAAASHWKTRSSLYGAILYYMQIGKQQTSVNERASSDMFTATLKESWEANTLSFISKQGEAFMEMLCRDACDGPEIGEMLAFAVLDSIVSIDWQERWAGFLSSRGYLRHLIESISEDDNKLQAVFLSDGDALKTVYSLESKLSFMTKFAKSEIGAQILLQSGLAPKLIECQFLNQRPNERGISMQLSKFAFTQHYDPLSPTKIEQYRIIFLAILKLLQAITSSLGPNHAHSLAELREIILSHEETFLDVLQGSTSCKSLESLRELSVVTSVVCLLRPRYEDPESVTDESKKARGFLSKLQRILLGLMQTFLSKDFCDQVTKNCMEIGNMEHSGGSLIPSSEVSLGNLKRILLQIRSNLIGYARGVVLSLGRTGAYCNIIFAPILLDGANNRKAVQDIRLKPNAADARKVSMSVLVEALDHTADDLIVAVNDYKKCSRKMEEIEDMSVEEILQLLSQEMVEDIERLTHQQRKLIAQKIIQQLLDLNDDQACLNIQIIESVLYIVWRHIEYYFVHCEPTEINGFQLDLVKTPAIRARRLQDVTLQGDESINKVKHEKSIDIGKYGVTKEEIDQLKVEAKTVLTDKLLKKVVQTEAIYGKTRSKVGFISAMVRRIQGLVKLHSR